MTLSRHFRLFSIAVIGLACGSVMAQSPVATYPDKPIRVIVPYSAGGPVDILGRIIGQNLTNAWGQQVIVENRLGANGIIGQEVVAKEKPDGYTLLVQSIAFAINPSLYKLPYDSDKDFVPVTQVSSTYLMLVVHPDVPVRNVGELIALAKAKPAQLNFASFGTGSIAHLAGEIFNTATGIKMTHVAYKGAVPALTDVISGQVQVMFPSIGSVLQYVKLGKLRGLGVTSRQRSSLAPEVPTLIESGLPDYESYTWTGLFFPAGTPQPIVSKLHREVERILRLPEVISRLESLDVVPVSSRTPEDFGTFVGEQIKKYSNVAKAAGLTVK